MTNTPETQIPELPCIALQGPDIPSVALMILSSSVAAFPLLRVPAQPMSLEPGPQAPPEASAFPVSCPEPERPRPDPDSGW
jgi:hypothetical protein